MKQLNAIIIEDELCGQEALVSLLSLYCPQVCIVGTAKTIQTATQLIKDKKPDLVFLDIILDEENGFDLLIATRPLDFQVIFTTSLDSYALKAFQANAADYLLKPIEPKALVKAVHKAQKLSSKEWNQERFALLLEAIEEKEIKRISIPSRKGITILPIKQIHYLHGSGAYTTLFTLDNQKITASNNLGYYHSLLPKSTFYRVHQSYLVNINFIKKILSNEGVLELCNGMQIPVAKSRRSGLLETLGK